MWWPFCKKPVSYIILTTVIALAGFSTALLVAVSTNVDISDDEAGWQRTLSKDI